MKSSILVSLIEKENKDKANLLSRFFKTGPGQYGEGDKFLGIVVPESRKIVKEFSKKATFDEIEELTNSIYHEARLVGLLILVDKFRKGDEDERKKIFEYYLKKAKKVNNWDLVDLTAPNIVGTFLLDKKDRKILDELSLSNNLWERRISIISTSAFIRNGEFDDCLRISKKLLMDKHDLIHKAVGWMLREVGKKDPDVLRKFLKDNYGNIPRTALRYSIERFKPEERRKWIIGKA